MHSTEVSVQQRPNKAKVAKQYYVRRDKRLSRNYISKISCQDKELFSDHLFDGSIPNDTSRWAKGRDHNSYAASARTSLSYDLNN